MQSSDKLVVEVFPKPEQDDKLLPEVIQHLISPGQEIGGDSRLLLPSDKQVATESENIGGQVCFHKYGTERIPCIHLRFSRHGLLRQNLEHAGWHACMYVCWLSSLAVCTSRPLHVVILPQPDVAF